jgi:hypothetical protein
VQNEPISSQLAKRSGALRFCASRRAARAEAKIAGMQNFFDLQSTGLQLGASARRLRKCQV